MVHCIKIMQWIMVSCCSEIMSCNLKMSLTTPLTTAKHHHAIPGPLLSVYTSFTDRCPFLRHLVGQDSLIPAHRNQWKLWNSAADDQNVCIVTISREDSGSPENGPEHPRLRTIAMETGFLKPSLVSEIFLACVIFTIQVTPGIHFTLSFYIDQWLLQTREQGRRTIL